MKNLLTAALITGLSLTFYNCKVEHNKSDQTEVEESTISNSPVMTDELTVNYNKGIEHFNKGVEILKNAPDDTVKLKEVRVEVKEHFAKAKPYFEKCLEIDPNHRDSKTAMKGINFMMGR